MNKLHPAVFLDRDGTINEDRDYLYKIEQFKYLDGAVEGLRALQEMGFLLVIITNQSGIARGYYTEADYLRLTDWMLEDLRKRGIRIAGVYYCPHHPEAKVMEYRQNCECRKPGTELFYRATKEHDIDLEHSIAIGDRERDLCICRETGARGILLADERSGNIRDTDETYVHCRNWDEIIKVIRG